MPIGYGKPDADKVPLVNLKLYSVALDVWPKRLLRDDGNPHLPAVHALFQIVRWYMPTEEFDGTKKERYYRKRYKGDQLQLSAPQLATASGLTVKQARDALTFLEEKGYINHTLRTICRDGLTFPNSQFIALNVEAVIKLSTVTKDDTDAMYKKAEQNMDWDDDDYSIVPQEASALQGIRSDPQDVRTLGASALQDRPFSPQVIHHKSLHQLPEESLSFRKSTELEKLSSVAQPEIVSPLSVSETDAVKPTGNGVMSTNTANSVYIPVAPDVAPDLAMLMAESLPAEPTRPVKEKAKPKRAAAKPKAPKPPKPAYALTQAELALIAELEAIDPNVAEAARGRCGKYRTSDPWSVSQVYLVTNVRVPKVLWSDVAAINGKSFDPKLLLATFKSWVSGHRQPDNLAWLLEWYKAGGPPQYKPNGYGAQQAAQQPAPASSKPEVAFDDPRVVDLTQWIHALPGYGGKAVYSIQLSAWRATNGDYDVAAQHVGDIKELHAVYLAEQAALRG